MILDTSATFSTSLRWPVRGILLWPAAGSSIPAGWALCDGGNETPDWRGNVEVDSHGHRWVYIMRMAEREKDE